MARETITEEEELEDERLVGEVGLFTNKSQM